MGFKYLLVVISTWVTQSSFATDGEKVTEIFNSTNFGQTFLSKSIFLKTKVKPSVTSSTIRDAMSMASEQKSGVENLLHLKTLTKIL